MTRVSWLAAVPEFKVAIVYVRVSSGRIDGAEADLAAVMRAISVVTVFEVEEPGCGVWPAQPTNVYVHVGVTWYRADAGATGMASTRSWNVASRLAFGATVPIVAPVMGLAPGSAMPSSVKLPATNDMPAGSGTVRTTLSAPVAPPLLSISTV